MRPFARSVLVALLCAVLCESPAMAAHRRVLGVVAQADRAHLGNANAVMGADVYSCDPLATDESGVLRVTVGSSQIFLSALSNAALEDDATAIQVVASGGTIGFSSPGSGDFSVRTPAGIVRGAAGAYSGQVAFKGPNELVVSAIRGDLTLDNGGQLRTIPEGKSADVTFDTDLNSGCHDEAAADQVQQKPLVQHKIGFYIIAAGAMAVPSYFIWRDLTESDSTPPTK